MGSRGYLGPRRPAEEVIGALDWPERVEVVDSHTEGEPTRVVVDGWPEMAEVGLCPQSRVGFRQWPMGMVQH